MAEKNKPLAALAETLKKPFGKKSPKSGDAEQAAGARVDETAERFATFYEFAPNMHEFLSFNGKGTAH